MKFIRTLKRMVRNSDRITQNSDRIAMSLEKLEELNRAIIEGMNNQSRLMNDKSNELIAASSSVDGKLAAICAGMDNQSRLMNDKSKELIAASSSADAKLAAIDAKLAATAELLKSAAQQAAQQCEALEGSIDGLGGNQRVVFDSLRFQLARIADLLRATLVQSSQPASRKQRIGQQNAPTGEAAVSGSPE